MALWIFKFHIPQVWISHISQHSPRQLQKEVCQAMAATPKDLQKELKDLLGVGPSWGQEFGNTEHQGYKFNRRKFRSETSDNMDSWKAEVRRVRREKIRRKKMQMREKVGKSRNTVFFQWFVAPEGRKVGSLKRRVRSQLARWEMKSLHAVVARSTFPSQNVQNTPGSDHFWKLRCRKVHAVVARSTFPSQNVQNTPFSDHFWKLRCRKVHAVVARSTFPSQNAQNTSVSDDFWKLRCRKSARRCGAKHISKSKCTKHTMLGPLLELRCWKSVEKKHAVVARSTFRSQKCKKLGVFSLFWREDVEKVDTD